MNPENKYSICINNKNEDCKNTENWEYTKRPRQWN